MIMYSLHSTKFFFFFLAEKSKLNSEEVVEKAGVPQDVTTTQIPPGHSHRKVQQN